MKKIKKIFSISLCLTLVSSILTYNSFAMWRGRPTFLDRGPVKHLTQKINKQRLTSWSFSWVELGVDAATFGVGGTVGKKVVTVALGQKGKEAICKVLVKAYMGIPNIEKAISSAVFMLNIAQKCDDVNKHGIKLTVNAQWPSIVECRCGIGKDHDMHYVPLVKLDFSTY